MWWILRNYVVRYDTKRERKKETEKNCQVLVDWLLNSLAFESSERSDRDKTLEYAMYVSTFYVPTSASTVERQSKYANGWYKNATTEQKYTEPFGKCTQTNRPTLRVVIFVFANETIRVLKGERERERGRKREPNVLAVCRVYEIERSTTENYVLVRRPRELVCRNSDMRVNVMMHTKYVYEILSTWPH